MRVWIPGKDERGDRLLCEAIRTEISANGGAISFARFMELCLQHPTRGYYRRGATRAGHGGDFLTSPEAHPAFAGVMARQLEVLFESIGLERATVVEAGAGTGTMTGLVATALEKSARVIALDSAAHTHDGRGALRVRGDSLPFASGSVDAIYANELLDAFPVHRLRRAGGAWRELFVRAESDEAFGLTERDASPRASALADCAIARGAAVVDGQIVEIAPAIDAFFAECARVIGRGFVVLADYGDDTPRLITADRPEGTLRCFAGHAIHHDALRYCGTQDMTASVDFGHAVEAARASGFETVAFLTQRAWLDSWGIADAQRDLPERDIREDEIETNVRAIDFLRNPDGLGAVKVIAFAKGLSARAIPGLTAEVPAARRFTAADVPLTRLLDPFADLYGD